MTAVLVEGSVLLSPKRAGFKTCNVTTSRGAPFSACTASSNVALNTSMPLTEMSLSPGSSRPSRCAMPSGTRPRMMIICLPGFIESCDKSSTEVSVIGDHFSSCALRQTLRGTVWRLWHCKLPQQGLGWTCRKWTLRDFCSFSTVSGEI